MSTWQKVKSKLSFLDSFGCDQYFRYEEASSYDTLAGSVCTFIIIVVFIASFFTQIIQTFRKQIIFSDDSVYKLENPTYSKILGNNSNFIFALGVSGANLGASDKRYFDFELKFQNASFGEFNSQTLPLTTCEKDSWARINDLSKRMYESQKLEQFLCPSPNYVLELDGKYSSDTFLYWRISVSKCDPTLDTSRPCASDSELESLKIGNAFRLNIYFINGMVNSGDKEPINFYFEDRYYFQINSEKTLLSNLYLSEYEVNTDESILPYEDPVTENIYGIEDSTIENFINSFDGKNYMKIYLRKSNEQHVSTRSFRKLFNLFGDIGGLVSFFFFLMFFMRKYSKYCYELEIGQSMFRYPSNNLLNAKEFNILSFCIYYPYELLKFLGLEIASDRMKQISECRAEVKHRLNVDKILSKISFLEKCITFVFEEHQLNMIHLQHKTTIEESEQLRKRNDNTLLLEENYELIKDFFQKKILHFRKKHLQNKGMIMKTTNAISNLKSKMEVQKRCLPKETNATPIGNASQRKDQSEERNQQKEFQKINSIQVSSLDQQNQFSRDQNGKDLRPNDPQPQTFPVLQSSKVAPQQLDSSNKLANQLHQALMQFNQNVDNKCFIHAIAKMQELSPDIFTQRQLKQDEQISQQEQINEATMQKISKDIIRLIQEAKRQDKYSQKIFQGLISIFKQDLESSKQSEYSQKILMAQQNEHQQEKAERAQQNQSKTKEAFFNFLFQGKQPHTAKQTL